jgi:hypothetical protein
MNPAGSCLEFRARLVSGFDTLEVLLICRRWRRLAVFPRAATNRVLQEFAEPEARLVQLGLGIPSCATQNFGNLVVFVSFHVVEDEHLFVSLRQLVNGPAQTDVVENSAEPEVRSAGFRDRPGVFLARLKCRVERHLWMTFLAKSHEGKVDREPVQPGGKFCFAAKCVNLAEEEQKSFLSQVFGFAVIFKYPQADGEDKPAVSAIELLERRGIALLGQPNPRTGPISCPGIKKAGP